MKALPTFLLALALVVSALSACNGVTPEGINSPEPQTSVLEPEKTLPVSPTETSETGKAPANSTDATPRELVEKAKSDLMKHLDITSDQIRIVKAALVDWPDASLGCPQPEIAYAQVITPGYYILLEAKGQQYPYHTDLEEQVILCLGNATDSGSELPLPLIPINPDEIMDGQPWMPVE